MTSEVLSRGALPKVARIPRAQEPSPGLSSSEANAWLGFLATHAELTKALEVRLKAQFGLSLSETEALSTLVHAKERTLLMSDLAVSTRLSRSGITRLVDRLEGIGLVRRIACGLDSRCTCVTPSQDGRRLSLQIVDWYTRDLRAVFFDQLDASQVRVLGQIWHSLLTNSESQSLTVAHERGRSS